MILFEGIQIQTIQECNLRCGFCPNSYLTQTKKKMPLEIYHKIIDELSTINYTGRVSPYLMNEPLLDDRLDELIAYSKKKLPKALLMISSNGTLLTKKRAEQLLNSGLGHVLVSCYTESIYDKIISFKMDNIRASRFFDKDLYKSFNNRGGNINVGEIEEPLEKICKHPFTQMYITVNGDAVLCCGDYKSEVIMGNINNDTLLNIWNNSKKYKQYREILIKSNREGLTLCNKCNY